jgi:hypothetical protein
MLYGSACSVGRVNDGTRGCIAGLAQVNCRTVVPGVSFVTLVSHWVGRHTQFLLADFPYSAN